MSEHTTIQKVRTHNGRTHARTPPWPCSLKTLPFHIPGARGARGAFLLHFPCPSCIGIGRTSAVDMIAKYTNHAMTKLHLSHIAERHPLEKPALWTETVERSSIFECVQKGDTVLNLGANIGRSDIVAAEAAGPEGRNRLF